VGAEEVGEEVTLHVVGEHSARAAGDRAPPPVNERLGDGGIRDGLHRDRRGGGQGAAGDGL
jgi:hypothetical protein